MQTNSKVTQAKEKIKQEKNNEKQNFINIFSNGMIDNGRSGNISKAEVILEALQKFNNKKTSAFFAEVFLYKEKLGKGTCKRA